MQEEASRSEPFPQYLMAVLVSYNLHIRAANEFHLMHTEFIQYANAYANDHSNLYKQRCKWIRRFTGNW